MKITEKNQNFFEEIIFFKFRIDNARSQCAIDEI